MDPAADPARQRRRHGRRAWQAGRGAAWLGAGGAAGRSGRRRRGRRRGE
ncbi:hypothetical protein ISF6_4338 [Piscinibacter sakaiensis]|uniref:Uncharacterized protein n=1 Tax=Piscinibacter sakaiensis TaxID=1547922 RepID=A0A0K8P6I3_PISS1|nr:hypothetical protein ISF6_4338 [Piscinibacter sakaiensis]